MLRQEGSRQVQEPKGPRIAFGQKMSRREQVAHRGLGVPRMGLKGLGWDKEGLGGRRVTVESDR